jgi:hypothetical protein
MADKIRVQGIREFQKALREMDRDLPKQIRLVFNDVTKLIVDYAAPRFPRKTGRAAASLKASSSQREGRVSLGSARAPYAPWLDFGGQGRVAGRPAPRPFVKDGRYVYQGLKVHRDDITVRMSEGLHALAAAAGLEMTSG